MRKLSFLLVIFLFSALQIFAQNSTEGALFAVSEKGKELGACPLKRANVKTDISGFVARVTVVQEFQNDFREPIEAVYTFPLSQNSAVDSMTMKIGERTIHGTIMRREEAKKVYEDAKNDGKTASLLDQERPNIFTQAVANILPNEKIVIEISYVETLKYEDGAYEFVFPMTIAPRYNPASVKAEDAQKVSPPVAATRAGHTISIDVNLNAGVPVEEIRSNSHEIQTLNLSPNSARVSLKDAETIPNKDFILRYDVAGKRIEDAILTHRDERGGFFTLVLQPPDKFNVEDVTPKEIVFVLDTSGSMSGFPIEKAKEAMRLSLENLYPYDTFNLITFAGDTAILFDKPVPATQANLEKAKAFLESRSGAGGTEMMKAVKAALAPSDAQDHIRVVCFMTDGVVSNEAEIIAEVQKHPQARVFSFGIGSSVNRYLLDKIAQEGRGEAEYVSLTDDGSKAAKRFYERVRTPLLTDISIEWNNLPVADIYPGRISDLFSAKPLILHGRFTKPASGTIRLKGKAAGQDFIREIAVNFPEIAPNHDVLATLWARTKIDDLMNKSVKYDKEEEEAFLDLKTKTQNEIVDISLKYNLLTQFTSFVAVEERVVTQGGKTKKIVVPVELPDGMKRQSGFQSSNDPHGYLMQITAGRRNTGGGIGGGRGSGSGNGNAMSNLPPNVNSITLSGGVIGNGIILSSPVVTPTPVSKTISGGVINSKATSLVKPSYPQAALAAGAGGAVNVQVVVDEAGNVISASAVSGHPRLRQAAEEAARNSKFSPTLLGGQPVKVTGVIVYNFTVAENSVSAPTGEKRVDENKKDETALALEREKLEKEARRRALLAEKLHFWIFVLVERLQKGVSEAAPNEAKFVSGGKADVQIWLMAKSPEVLKQLKDSGFEIVENKMPKVVNGRIAIEKLAALAEISEVQYVLPGVK